YPRLGHSALVCWPGLLFTETTSLDSGSMRHMASTRLQESWARSFKPNWRRSSPEPNVASLPVETEEGEVRFDQSRAEGIDIRAFWARSRSICHRGILQSCLQSRKVLRAGQS